VRDIDVESRGAPGPRGSSNWRLRWQQRRATIAFALQAARKIPDCFNREPITFAHPICLCHDFLKYGRCASNPVEQKRA
jgi:hypothetical protein